MIGPVRGMDVVVPLDPLVVAGRAVGERQLPDQAALGQQVQRAVDRPVGDLRVPLADQFEDLARGQVPVGAVHHVQDLRSLRGVAVRLSHDLTIACCE